MASLLAGSFAGLSATVPMSGTMLALRNRLPSEWFSPLPPRRITLRAARKAGVLPRLGWTEREAFSWVAHFGFGAAAGTAFSRWPGRRGIPPLWAGPLYGLGVWAAAYLGIMPALGLHPSALRDRRTRNGLMIASHLVWGLSLSLALRLLARPRGRGETSWSADIESEGW